MPACATVVAADSSHGEGFATDSLISYQLGDLVPDDEAVVTISWFPGVHGEQHIRATAATTVPESGLAPNSYLVELDLRGDFAETVAGFTRYSEGDGDIEVLWPIDAANWELQICIDLREISWRGIAESPTLSEDGTHFVQLIEDAPVRLFVRWVKKGIE